MSGSAHSGAATNARSFRSFLLMAQLEAREIGARIQQARNERGLTQDELAELADVSVRALQTWESGKVIPYRHFRDLARLLKKQEEWFLYGEPEPAEDADVAERLGRIEQILEELAARLDQDEPGSQRGG